MITNEIFSVYLHNIPKKVSTLYCFHIKSKVHKNRGIYGSERKSVNNKNIELVKVI